MSQKLFLAFFLEKNKHKICCHVQGFDHKNPLSDNLSVVKLKEKSIWDIKGTFIYYVLQVPKKFHLSPSLSIKTIKVSIGKIAKSSPHVIYGHLLIKIRIYFAKFAETKNVFMSK